MLKLRVKREPHVYQSSGGSLKTIAKREIQNSLGRVIPRLQKTELRMSVAL